MTWVLLLALGCGRGEDLAGCGALPPGPEQENCRLAALRGLPVEEAARQIEAVPGAASRDLLRVQLVVEDPARYGALCADVRHGASADWCRDVLDRVHLREPAPGPPP